MIGKIGTEGRYDKRRHNRPADFDLQLFGLSGRNTVIRAARYPGATNLDGQSGRIRSRSALSATLSRGLRVAAGQLQTY
jgi:hypothetical protein